MEQPTCLLFIYTPRTARPVPAWAGAESLQMPGTAGTSQPAGDIPWRDADMCHQVLV